MIHQLEFIFAFGLINKLNKARYEQTAPLTAQEQKTLNEWIAKSDNNRCKYERYTCREWLYWGNIMLKEIQYILCIEDLLFVTFQVANEKVSSRHYRYFLLNALYVVVGLSDEELEELKTWAAQSPQHKRVFDLFTSDKYAAMAIELVKKFTNEGLYQWYMGKYHTKPPTNSIWRMFRKKKS